MPSLLSSLDLWLFVIPVLVCWSLGESKAVSITREATCLRLESGRQLKCKKSEIIRIHRQPHTDWPRFLKKQLQIAKFCGHYPSLWEGSPIHLFSGSLVAAGKPLLNGVHCVGRKASFPQRLSSGTNHKAAWTASMPPALLDHGWNAIGAELVLWAGFCASLPGFPLSSLFGSFWQN